MEESEIFWYSSKYIDLIKMCNSKTMLKVNYQQELSEVFEVKSGLRQGDAISPMLFNVANMVGR